jgi:hypothetical protein
MKKRLSLALLPLVAVVIPFAARGQVPVAGSQWAIYSIVYQLDATSRSTGHVIVRGANAGNIPGVGLQAGYEHWIMRGITQGAGSPGATLRLEELGPASDAAIRQRVPDLLHTEQMAGSYPIVGSWQPFQSPGGDASVYQLDSVVGGPAGRTWPLHQIALVPSSHGDPTIYAADGGIQTVFGPIGGAFPLAEGCEARFTRVAPGQAGYPQSSWVWTNHAP